jgi:hypothetical protein
MAYRSPPRSVVEGVVGKMCHCHAQVSHLRCKGKTHVNILHGIFSLDAIRVRFDARGQVTPSVKSVATELKKILGERAEAELDQPLAEAEARKGHNGLDAATMACLDKDPRRVPPIDIVRAIRKVLPVLHYGKVMVQEMKYHSLASSRTLRSVANRLDVAFENAEAAMEKAAARVLQRAWRARRTV